MAVFRQAGEKDYIRINDFHNKIYKKNRTIEQFRWEFHDAPAGPSIYIIAEENEQVIGTQCAIPIYFITSTGKKILTGKSEDTLVDPQFRGSNIFYEMYDLLFQKCIEQKLQFIWGFTYAVKPFRKMGFETPYLNEQVLVVNRIQTSFHFLLGLKRDKKFVGRIRTLGLCIASSIRNQIQFEKSLPSGYVVRQEVVEQASELQMKNLKQDGEAYAVELSWEYLRWRIYKNPNYTKLHSWTLRDQKQQLIGFYILNSYPGGAAYAINSGFDPQLSRAVVSSFLRKVTFQLFREGIVLIQNWAFSQNALNKNEIEEFVKAGYFHVRKGNSLVWKKMGDSSLDPHHFYISRISSQGNI